MASKGAALGKIALGMLNAEKKYYDSDIVSTTPAGPTGTYVTFFPFDDIVEGDGPTARNGVQIRVKSLQIRALCRRNASADVTRIRWALVLDRRVQVGSDPTWTDLYDDTNLSQAFLNMDAQWKRFKILRQGTQTLSTDNQEQELNIYMPMSMQVRYDNSDNVILGRMFFIAASDEATNTPTFNYRYRVRFYDN